MSDISEMEPFDVIVVGAGAGGGVAACLAAEAGKRVLLLERGRAMNFDTMPIDHLRNHRLALYGHNTGPDLEGNPRVTIAPSGNSYVVSPIQGGYGANAAAVGGGTLVYGAQAWRFKPLDFRMASEYGIPEGSSLSDWPISYQELAPYYERAEWEVGVAGEDVTIWDRPPNSRGLPMPPVPSNPHRVMLANAAKKLGWISHAVPLLINTIPFNGRPPCVQCGNCVGFPCPSNGKNGTQNTMIPRALATGNCTLITRAMAEKIVTDSKGQAIGVSFFVEDRGGLARRTVRAKTVVVSCGAIESARLLLNSKCDGHPRGLGNDTDQVGRHLQGHYYPFAAGYFDEQHHTNLGPGVSISTTQFNHGNKGIVGGGMIANEFVKIPAIFVRGMVPPEVPRWGLAHKQWMRHNYTRAMHITGPVQEIPHPDGRVQVDDDVKDKFGIPVIKSSGTTHPETVKTAEFMLTKKIEWLNAAGAKRVMTGPIGLHLGGGQHQSGTCRMGNDPKTSVTDSWGKVHGQENLYVADGGLHVTNGGFNPVLTILALGFRVGEAVAKR
jgi:choline dehydrogenase-like flavoprotein